MKLLIKFPTRSRPEKFLKVLEQYREAMVSFNTKFLITLDIDDHTMLNANVISKLNSYNSNCDILAVSTGMSLGKIHACNRGLEDKQEFDIILLASDDMIPQVAAIDKIIIECMEKLYPDTDGALWFNDGFTGSSINTIVCIGRKRYEKFGYLYHPSYKSLFADNEYTEVGIKDRKLKYISDVILRHEHPMRVKGEMDDLYRKNENYWKEDQANYRKRKALKFPI